MKLVDLRRAARDGIEPGSGVAKLEVFKEDRPMFPPEVQLVWDQIQTAVTAFVGEQITKETLDRLRGSLIGILRMAHTKGVLRLEDPAVINTIKIEVNDSELDVVWPAQVRIWFEEQAEIQAQANMEVEKC